MLQPLTHTQGTRLRRENSLGGRLLLFRHHSFNTFDGKINSSVLFAFDADQVASQLTLIEAEMFCAVQPSEFDGNAWQDPKMRRARSPFLTTMVDYSNKVIAWIEREVCDRHGARQTEALERAISLAERCHALRNYNAFMEVHLGLSQASVACLKEAWARVGSKFVSLFAAHEELLSPVSNYRSYRKELKEVLEQRVPVLPYVGTFLRDAFFVNEANPAWLPSGATRSTSSTSTSSNSSAAR